MSVGFILAPQQDRALVAQEVSPDLVRLTVSLAQADRSLDLTGEWSVLAGVEGFDDLQVGLLVDQLTGTLGEAEAGLAVAGRDVWLPLRLLCRGGSAWERARRALRDVTNPLQGPTTVRVTRPDGSVREITGRAQVRVDSWDVETWDARGWQVFGVLVHCAQPWWRQPDAVRERWTSPSTAGWFDTDIGELQLEPDATTDEPRTLDVDCDADTYPTVVITDTAGVVTLTHSSGRSWSIDCTGAAMPVTVVTDPTRSAVTDGTGADAWSRMAAPADLWPVVRGAQQVTVSMTGYTASTTVELWADGLMLAALT